MRIDGDRAPVGGHVGRVRVGDELLLALRAMSTDHTSPSPLSYAPNTSPGSRRRPAECARTNSTRDPSAVHVGWMSS